MRNRIARFFTSGDMGCAPITQLADACCRFTGLAARHSYFQQGTRHANIGNDVVMAPTANGPHCGEK